MADRKWLSDFRSQLCTIGLEGHLLLKFGDDISNRFGDSERNFGFSKSRDAAILDFFKKRRHTCPLIFLALSNPFYRLSIRRLGAEKKGCSFLPFVTTKLHGLAYAQFKSLVSES